MSLWAQALIVFGVLLLVMGYFQYRRTPDVIAIAQEMFRPTYLLPAAIGAVVYLVLKFVLSVLDGVL